MTALSGMADHKLVDTLLHVVAEVKVKKIYVRYMIIATEVKKAPGKFRFLYKEQTILYLRIGGIAVNGIEFKQHAAAIVFFGDAFF